MHKLTIAGCLLLLSMFTHSVFAQTPWALAIPSSYTNGYEVSDEERYNVLNSEACWVDLSDALGPNPDMSGNTNYAAEIQALIQSSTVKNFKMPDFPVRIDINTMGYGLDLPDDCKLYFPPNAQVKMGTYNQASFKIIRVGSKSNVTIYFAHILGDRATHTGSAEDWGGAITLMASSDIKIIKPVIKDSWGSGILIQGTSTVAGFCEDVLIEKAICDNNRSNAISIISAKNLTISGAVLSNTNGYGLHCGLNIQPATNTNSIENINLNDLVTFHNYRYGLVVDVRALRNKTPACNLSVITKRHIDDQSYISSFVGAPVNAAGNPNTTGYIRFYNPGWLNPRGPSNTSTSNYLQAVTVGISNSVEMTLDWACGTGYDCTVNTAIHNVLTNYYSNTYSMTIPPIFKTFCNTSGWIGSTTAARTCP